MVASPTMLAVGSSYATRGHDFRLPYRKLGQDMIYVNIISLIEL